MASSTFLKAIENRRTIYDLTNQLPISDLQLEDTVRTVVQASPTAYNHQGTKIVVLLKTHHKAFWDIARRVLKAQLGSKYEDSSAGKRVHGFEAAYGTALFFEDPHPKKEFQSRFKQSAEHFNQWAEHGNAMAQFALWTALSAEGCGCSLQHYNPIIDIPVKEEWGIDHEWQLKAQLVFGGLGEDWKKSISSRDSADGRYKIYSD